MSKQEYWYSSRGLPKICTLAGCMLMGEGEGGRGGRRERGGRRIGLCSRIRLSAPVVRSPAPPSRDTPRSPSPPPFRFTGFLHSTTPRHHRHHRHHHHYHHAAFLLPADRRPEKGRKVAEIGRSIDPLPIETVSISKICRVSRDVEVLAFDVWETARGKTGKKVSTNAREVGFEFWRMDFYTGIVIVVPSAFFFNGRDFTGSGIELKVRGRKYYFFARKRKIVDSGIWRSGEELALLPP